MPDRDTPLSDPLIESVVRDLLRGPEIHQLLADVLAERIRARRGPSLWQRLQPWVAGAASALVTVLAFFLPSLQDQWDRLQARRVIERYVDLGQGFMHEGRYKLAEDTFAKAFELSENKRLDVEEKRLEAKVAQVSAEPEWGEKNPPGLKESDFLYLIQLQKGRVRARMRADAIDSYGVFLVGDGRPSEAVSAFRQALRLDPKNAAAWVHLGNLLSDEGRTREAEKAYLKALAVLPRMQTALYNLGLLLAQTGRATEAEAMFRRAVAAAPGDADALRELAEALDKHGKRDEAKIIRKRLARALTHRPAVPAGAVAKKGASEDSPE